MYTCKCMGMFQLSDELLELELFASLLPSFSVSVKPRISTLILLLVASDLPKNEYPNSRPYFGTAQNSRNRLKPSETK